MTFALTIKSLPVMKHFKLYIFYGLFFFNTLLSTAYGSEPKIYLDAHLHFDSLNLESFNKHLKVYLQNTTAEKMFLISPSYAIWDKYVKGDPAKHIERLDNLTAKVVQNNKDRMIGLCGYSYTSKFTHELAKDCLQLSGMKGIKIRISGEDDLSVLPAFYSNVIKLLSNPNNKAKVVLIHLPDNHSDLRKFPDLFSKDERERILSETDSSLKEFYHLVDSLRSVQFVIAHSNYSPKYIKDIARQLKKLNLQNVWLETSTALTLVPHSGKEPNGKNTYEEYAESWREFGINKVLFGSDSIIGNSIYELYGYEAEEVNPQIAVSNFHIQKNKLINKTNLTNAELKLIFQQNAKKLLSLIED